MNRLWAPWRVPYLKGEKPVGCIFCDKPKEDRDEDNLILHRGTHHFVIMNLFPYSNGHLMIVPYLHTDALEDLDAAAAVELFDLIKAARKALLESMNPEGFNVGINLGRVAGAGIHEHVHVHVVPRWLGDTNFMPTLAGTKVISEHIQESYRKLAPHFADWPGR
ncbi:MAG: HIT domain-containing protein [Deltaproteobacteria bacterium]|nr:HIT domain-containing protein [Deltaproteobacteria bacterium]